MGKERIRTNHAVQSSMLRILAIELMLLLLFSLLLASLTALPPKAGAESADPLNAKIKVPSPSSSLTSVKGDGTHYLGYQPTPPGDYPRLVAPKALKALPSSVDLSADLPPVGDQGRQGSCVGWATSYYYKTWLEKQEHTSWDLSNPWYQFSPSFVYNQINGGFDLGAFISSAFYLMETKGDVDIEEMPYDDSDWTTQPTAADLEAAKPYRIPEGWGYLWIQWWFGPYNPPNPIENAKALIASGKMLVMGIPIYSDFPDFGANLPRPYYDYNETSPFVGGHAVCITGYDDNANPSGADPDHRGGFKMVNSWGITWNGLSRGFVYLSYDFVKRYVREAWTTGDIIPDSPFLSSVNPQSAPIGATVTINGNNFGTKRRNARVTFGSTEASEVTFTNECIEAKVPLGAKSGPIIVYDWEGTPSNPANFEVLPTIFSISPPSAVAGAVVSINGSEFGAAQGSSSVWFGNVQASDYFTWTNERIECRVPSAPPGGVSVKIKGSIGDSNEVPFLIGPVSQPTVASIVPQTGVENTVVEIADINGANFYPGASVQLERSGTIIKANDVNILSETKITCRLNLSGAPRGKYDVVVKNLDNQQGKLLGGFTVTNICGLGAGASLVLFFGFISIMSIASSPKIRRKIPYFHRQKKNLIH